MDIDHWEICIYICSMQTGPSTKWPTKNLFCEWPASSIHFWIFYPFWAHRLASLHRMPCMARDLPHISCWPKRIQFPTRAFGRIRFRRTSRFRHAWWTTDKNIFYFCKKKKIIPIRTYQQTYITHISETVETRCDQCHLCEQIRQMPKRWHYNRRVIINKLIDTYVGTNNTKLKWWNCLRCEWQNKDRFRKKKKATIIKLQLILPRDEQKIIISDSTASTSTEGSVSICTASASVCDFAISSSLVWSLSS